LTKVRFEVGSVVAVKWIDVTMKDRVRAIQLESPRYIDRLTRIIPTITYGIVVGVDNGCVVLAQEYCCEKDSDSTLIEIIPFGVIIKITKYQDPKELKKLGRRKTRKTKTSGKSKSITYNRE
jgi:hypothetical protein